MSTLDCNFTASALLLMLNSWADRPADAGFEAYLAGETGMKLHMLADGKICREYTDGGYIASVPFAVYVRIRSADSADSLDSMHRLFALAEWLRERPMPELSGGCEILEVQLTALPALYGSRDDGYEEYGAEFRIVCKVKNG